MALPFAAIPGLISGAGLIGKGISGLFGHHAKNPASAAMPYLNQIPAQANQYLGQYAQQGQQVNPLLQQQSSQMFSHPNDFFNQIGSGYKESPGYQFTLQQALNAANNASSAGGMTGTGQHAQQNAQVAGDIASQDYQKYIANIMHLLGVGQEGLQGLSNQGYGASTNLADLISSALGSQAQYAYAGQNAKNEAKGANWSNIFGGGAALGSAFMPDSWGNQNNQQGGNSSMPNSWSGSQYGNRGY